MDDLKRKRLDKLADAVADVDPERVDQALRKSERIHLRLSPVQKDAIKKAAQHYGLPISEYLLMLHELVETRRQRRAARKKPAPTVMPTPLPKTPAKKRTAKKAQVVKSPSPPKAKPTPGSSDVRVASLVRRVNPWTCSCGEKDITTINCPGCGEPRSSTRP